MSFRVVFIDDNLTEKEPFVQSIRKTFTEADCSQVFKDPDEGVQYVLENLNERMIVFIDWNFGSSSKKGLDLLKEIRSQTSLLYVVMMSANPLNTIPSEAIIEMINDDNIFYLDRSNSDFEMVKTIIEQIQREWKTKFDCILERWLIRHLEYSAKVAYRTTEKTYTWADILLELRHQSDIGKSFEGMLNQYYIHTIEKLEG